MNDYHPDTVTPPGATLAETIEARGMTLPELAEATGLRINTLRGLVCGLVAMSETKALLLERALGIPAEFWMRREAAYREHLVRLAMDRQVRVRARG